MRTVLFAMVLALGIPAVPGAAAERLDATVQRVLAKSLLTELGGANAKRSIRGTKALWIDLSLQKPDSLAMDNLELDLRQTEMEAQLRQAGFRVMDPKKRSLAVGLRPTLLLTVLYFPKGSEGNDAGFYLVIARATQDVTPLGGERTTMTTWLKPGEPIVSSGDAMTDLNAIRASARAGVRAFIEVAQDQDSGVPAAEK